MPEPQVLRAKRRPRVLLIGGDESAERALKSAFPTVQRTTPRMEGLALQEWDVVVLIDEELSDEPPGWLNLLALGTSTRIRWASGEAQWLMMWAQDALGDELQVPSDLPPRVEQLTRATIAQSTRSPHWRIEAYRHIAGGRRARMLPFLRTTAGAFLAGELRRSGQSALWMIPTKSHVREWALAAVESWRPTAPDRLPPFEPPWSRVDCWTAVEQAAATAFDGAVAERQARLQELDQLVSGALAALEGAHERAIQGWRRLLTSQGDGLRESVERAFTVLGFATQNMDDVHPEGDRREDLRLSDGAWTAVVEVRGYAGGAQLGDLFRLGRFAGRYSQETGREPEACWYVVNQFIGDDPADRPGVLSGNPGEVATFASDYRGLLADTTDLFRAVRAVESGRDSAEVIRRRMKGTVGVFRY